MYLTFVTLLLLLSTLGVNAQNSITLSFNSTSNIDSVRIDNLDNASYKVLKDGTFSILLQFGLPNKIESIHVFSEPLVYPNPFKQQVNFEFNSANQNNVNLAVYDLSGKVVAQYNQKIDVGSHRFTFRPDKPGVYLMKVSDKSNVYTSTIICQESSSGQSGIEYSGLVDAPKSKSPQMVRANAPNSSTGFSANFGDLLRFTGYSGTKINSMYDFANSTKKYTFTFTDRYFKFKNYNIQASKPCFVDVMFSVTDQNNKGVDYLTNSDFSVLEDNAPTSPSETFRYVRKMQQIPSKIKTVLLLDNSTSVSADIEAIKNAAIKFVQTIREGQEIAIYVFSDTPVLLQNFTTNKNLLETAIKSIGSGYPSTNLYGSIITGLSIWNDIYTLSSITQGSLIVFTDGSDTQGSSTLNSVISSRGDKKIYVIGLGGEINPAALNQIANPGPYYPIQKAGELDAVFATIQSDIVQFSNSFYWLNYMSPKRTGTHTLKVSAANNTNTSSTSYLTGSFSAAGFQSVKSGVYANIDDNHLYGLDTIHCYYSSDGYLFSENNLTMYSKDSLVLKPVTYWAFKPPVYSWTTDNNNVYQTAISAYSQLTIKPKEAKSDTSTITLKDEANNYTRKITIILNPLVTLGKLSTYGLVAWYPFNGNANDESGNGNNGTVNGAKLTLDKFENSNNAFYFDGNSNISLPNPFFNGTQVDKFTIYSRIRFDDLSTSRTIWAKELFWGEVVFSINKYGYVELFWANSINGNKYSRIMSNPNEILTNNWYDIIIVYQNSVAQIYINSKAVETRLKLITQDGTSSSTTIVDSYCNFAQIAGTSNFGKIKDSSSNFFGTLDNFALWNRALTQEEIINLYNVK